MFNYGNLNDVEFEYLCNDIMSKRLGTTLRMFASGKDHGIDLTNDVNTNEIVIQIKHYIRTDINGLIRSLKKEVINVNKINPKQYYICCSKELSCDKIKEIFNLFSNYMETDKNIITLIEIDAFLIDPKNIDILRKHYKLWISSTGVLQDLMTSDIFIDCEVLLSDVEKQVKYFVQTIAYNQSLQYLEKNNTLFITGDPGVGKTITSKMLVLHFSTQGYRVRYTTNGTDLNQLKKSLSHDKGMKEIILLDDCFGQAYFNMKESQGNELLSLIKYIHLSRNKLLILNSRVTIYQEAKTRTPELITSLEDDEFKMNIIDINQMSRVEKAKIYYNHLYFNQMKDEFWLSIRKNRCYRKIVDHKNYNPRIIEFISKQPGFEVLQNKDYSDFVMESLDYPQKIWKNEYENRLEKVDRILLSTLYSLTETYELLDYVQCIYNERLSNLNDIDTTINHFECSLLRLQDSFIKIVVSGSVRYLSMVNPSVNDFLGGIITPDSLEYRAIVSNSASVKQLQRMLSYSEYNELINVKMKDFSILTFIFENQKKKNAYITYKIMKQAIFRIEYKKYIWDFLKFFDHIDVYDISYIDKIEILQIVFREDFYSFYLEDYFNNWDVLSGVLCLLDFEYLVKTICLCYDYFSTWHENILQLLITELEKFCVVDADNYENELYSAVDDSIDCPEAAENFCISQASEELVVIIENDLYNEIEMILLKLPDEFDIDYIKNYIEISVYNSEEVVESYFKANYLLEDDVDRRDVPIENSDYSEIDYIFDRP